MSKYNNFEWIEWYREFADKLLAYKEDRSSLIEIIESVYDEIDINLPTLEKDNDIVDIDPFTVFGLFNKSSLKEENKIKIISSFSDKLGVSADIPESFNGVPVVNNQNAIFYKFIDERGKDDIQDLWDLFYNAIKYADNQSNKNKAAMSKYFDAIIVRKGIGNSKLTMGLFWIAPHIYLNLDQRNVWYIYESGKLPSNVIESLPDIEPKIPAKKYFDVIEKVRECIDKQDIGFNDFMELSVEAWSYSTQVNEEKKAESAQTQRNSKGAGLADEDVDTVHYWLYSPGEGAYLWDYCLENNTMVLGWGDIGDLSSFSTKDEMKEKMKEVYDPDLSYRNAALATWQFSHEMKEGDIIFAKKGLHQIIGKGVVTSPYEFDDESDDEYAHCRSVSWTHYGEWEHPGNAALKALTDITAYTDYVDELLSLFDEDGESDIIYPEYSKEKFLEEVFLDEEEYDKLVGLLRVKKNIILQGAPGVGKTYAAKRLAYSIIGCKDQERVMMVQFHQSYSYEDFIEGFRPTGTGQFDIKKGSFYNFCKKAADDQDNDYFFIIDEINRGNLSKIFGELFMLIENDKRGNALMLLYSDEKFYVPKNVHIIGMMNTADRSLAMLDYALRRRFAFYELKPAFDSDGFREYRMELDSEELNSLVECVEKLNNVISNDESLGDGFCIGHSYFCELEEADYQTLSNIVEYELIPMLKEYWFDEPQKVRDWSENLRSSIK
ncbi:MAG: AAA family ATPase [Mogibacterium sp.]|nr:AAA family ATPase [Mogibacterium sp.]